MAKFPEFKSADEMHTELTKNPQLINIQDENGDTILHHTPLNVRCEHYGWALKIEPFITKESLLIKNNDGCYPLDVSIAYAEIGRCRAFIMVLLKKSNEFGIRYEEHIDLTQRMHPLHMLISAHRDWAFGFGNNYDTVSLFIECCPDTFNLNLVYHNTKFGDEITPLTLALLENHIEEVKTLLEKGANPSLGKTNFKNVLEEKIKIVKDNIEQGDAYKQYYDQLLQIKEKVST